MVSGALVEFSREHDREHLFNVGCGNLEITQTKTLYYAHHSDSAGLRRDAIANCMRKSEVRQPIDGHQKLSFPDIRKDNSEEN